MSVMRYPEVVWLRVRGRDGDRPLRKKLRVSLHQLVSMHLAEFLDFLKVSLELERPLVVAYSDDEGDEIPVTSDSELNVMVYMAEVQARQGRALELRLRDAAPAAGAAAEEHSLTSARQLARRQAAQKVATRHEETRCRLERGRSDQRRHGDRLWARVDAWQQGCLAGGGGGGGESLEDGWRPPPPPAEPAQLQQPARSRGPPPAPLQEAAAASRAREKRREAPAWFSSFMAQFQKDLVAEVVEVVKAELTKGPPGCLCTGATDTEPTPKTNDCSNASSQSVSDQKEASVSQPEDPSRVVTAPCSPWSPMPASVRTRRSAAPEEPPPQQETAAAATADAGVQTAGAEPRPAAPPVDQYGLFSVTDSADSSDSGRQSSGVSSAAGRSVTGVHTGSTVYSAGGGSVETTGGGGRPALLRTAYSVPAGRPRPRPRRLLTEADDADYSCMLVMVEHAAAELDQGAPPERAVADAGGAAAGAAAVPPPEEEEQRRRPQQQEPPVSVDDWLASEPPMSTPLPSPPPPPPADAVDAPKLETAVKRLATARYAEPEPEPEPEPKPKPKPEPEPELEEGFVTVNGRRLSLSEDEFSDIVIISSPGGSERFELVEELPETEEEEEEDVKRPPPPATPSAPPAQAVPIVAGEAPMVTSALSDRWVDAAAWPEGSGSGGSMGDWAASSAGSEVLRSTCVSAPAACPIEISSPEVAAVAERTASLPVSARLPEQLNSAAPRQPAIPERTVSPMDPLSSLSGPLLSRLLENLQRMPEPRQKQLASDLTGRRCVEPFWERLGKSAADSGRSRMAVLLEDQAERPAGVAALADSLDGMLRHIKVSASSSSQLDGMGAQAVKHALCLLRDCLRGEESADETGTPPPATPGQAGPQEQETPRQEMAQETTQETPRQEAVQQERSDWEEMYQEYLFQQQQQQQQQQHEEAPRWEGTYQEGQSTSSSYHQESLSGSSRHSSTPSWLSHLVGLLPDSVLNMLRQSGRRGSRGGVPSEAEALMISRLVEMGFYDLDRMRELYQEFGDDCNLIASHLIDSDPSGGL